MSDIDLTNGALPCDVCGAPATTSDGVCVADLCDSPACLDVAWCEAFETSPSGLWCHSCGLHMVTTAMQLCPSCAGDQRRASS